MLTRGSTRTRKPATAHTSCRCTWADPLNPTTAIREARPHKPVLDPLVPAGTTLEDEPTPGGTTETSYTVFLTGAECPFTCSFCDLWKHTLEGPTPVGAIPTQLRRALEDTPSGLDPSTTRLKLYNASNFFDARAVPVEDDDAVLEACAPFPSVTVENHPRLLNDRCFEFAHRLSGRLEVAMGLEAVDPDTLAGLNKRSTVEDFDRATAALLAEDIDVRAFVLLSPPGAPPGGEMDGCLRSVEHALGRGARFCAINPVRPGNGHLDRLRETGAWSPPSLALVERTLEAALGVRSPEQGVVVADLWEIDRFDACDGCRPARIRRLEQMNLTQAVPSGVGCADCDD